MIEIAIDMDLERLRYLVEQLRLETVGEPNRVESRGVFEYPTQSIEVVVVLKLVRAAQGIHALDLLCREGLFVDMGAIYRGVNDCVAEVYFLLENYPKKSASVDKFLKEFFSKGIDGYLTTEEEPVQTKKIHNAMVRALTGNKQDERVRQLIKNIYKTFSGYTHASYAHIMQMYGGPSDNWTFNISGIKSESQRAMYMQLVEEAHGSLLYVMAYVAKTFGLLRLNYDIMDGGGLKSS